MTNLQRVLPIALLVCGCFEDMIGGGQATATDGMVTAMPVVPVGATGDTDPMEGSSSGSSSEGSSSGGTEPRCGDGSVDVGEGCDDGNERSGDGCSATCVTEPRACAGKSATIGEDLERGIGVCRDNSEDTCEKDFANLCAPGWHLCSWNEHVELNDGLFIELGDVAAVGVVRCRALGGSGHYTTHDFSLDGPDSCEIGSSRPDCPTNLGCNETMNAAMCCAPIPSCGNGTVDDPREECDDGNEDDFDECSNSCASRQGSGPFC